MRKIATNIEQRIRDGLSEPILRELGLSIDFDESVSDRPDLVFMTSEGVRIGIEITRLGYEKYMHWQSKGTEIGKQRKAHIHVNLHDQLKD